MQLNWQLGSLLENPVQALLANCWLNWPNILTTSWSCVQYSMLGAIKEYNDWDFQGSQSTVPFSRINKGINKEARQMFLDIPNDNTAIPSTFISRLNFENSLRHHYPQRSKYEFTNSYLHFIYNKNHSKCRQFHDFTFIYLIAWIFLPFKHPGLR